jgi:hypothetical protein
MATANDAEIIASVFSAKMNQDGFAYDNIFGRVPTVKYLMVKDQLDKSKNLATNERVKEFDGGQDIELPLEYAVGTGAQSFDGLDIISFAPKENLTNAKFDWKHVVQTGAIDKKDILKVAGSAAKISSLVDTKLRNWTKSMATTLNNQLLAQSAAVGAKDIHAIAQLVKDAPSGAGVIGGIDPSVAGNSWWRNQFQSSSGSTYAGVMAEIVNMKNDIQGNMAGDAPDLALTDQLIYETLIGYATSKGTHTFINTEMSSLLDVDVMKVRGMNLIWDASCPESTVGSKSRLFMLNTDYLKFAVHSGRKFEISEKMDLLASQGQDAWAWAIFLMGNLICANRKKQGVLFNLTQNITS